MVSMIHGFRVHQNLNRPTSKANERTVNQQKTPILGGEAALHKIVKQFYIGTFFACMCLRPQKHKKHIDSKAYRTTAKVQILSLWVQRSILVLSSTQTLQGVFFQQEEKLNAIFNCFQKNYHFSSVISG